MEIIEQRPSRVDDDRSVPDNSAGSPTLQAHPIPNNNGIDDPPQESGRCNVYTIMVAGQRTGKTSFLRLLLDTCDISPLATKDQLGSVAKFVRGCSGHTSHIRSAAIDINLDLEGNDRPQRLTLSLIDTPSLDFRDETACDRLVVDMLRHIDSRLAEGVDDDWKAQTGDHFIHLCIYFLDPDFIVPPSVPAPPAPPVHRARTTSFSQAEQETVILEPPVTTNPLLCRPTLPVAEISTIRRLSARVNVLPVIARADTLTNERLAAVKMAVRRDLAEAGIGFGIFDIDGHSPFQHHNDLAEHPHSGMNGDVVNGYPNTNSGSASSSPSSSPANPSFLRLPYALISPDVFSHSDGVARIPLSREQLVRQYTPSPNSISPSKIVRGRFVRSYRWGSMDVLDPNHSDFLPFRNAMFHHMQTLQKYTREYLFDKFRVGCMEYLTHRQPSSNHALPRHLGQATSTRVLPATHSHTSHPMLGIETSSSHSAMNRHPPPSLPHDMQMGDHRGAVVGQVRADSTSNRGTVVYSRSSRPGTRKITVACNFCRSRKLKCDGGRPACSQCIKRSNPCDYMPHSRRRSGANARQRKAGADESEIESDGNRSAAELSHPHPKTSQSPEVPSLPVSRRPSHSEKMKAEPYPERLEEQSQQQPPPPLLPPPPPSLLRTPVVKEEASRGSAGPSTMANRLFKDNELPHIATLSLPRDESPTSAVSLPSMMPGSSSSTTLDQAAQRRRAVTLYGNSTSSKRSRQSASGVKAVGPKVVACDFCRARKTKCDGVHPTCSSCARRSLLCNYMHNNAPNGQWAKNTKKMQRRASTSRIESSPAAPLGSPPAPLPTSPSPIGMGLHNKIGPEGYDDHHQEHQQQHHHRNGGRAGTEDGGGGGVDLKRPMDESDAVLPQKKVRVDDSSGGNGGSLPAIP